MWKDERVLRGAADRLWGLCVMGGGGGLLQKR